MSRGRTWTEEEETYLKTWYGKKPVNEIAEKLGRGHTAIGIKASKLRLTFRTPIIWTAEERSYLAENADKISLKEISKTIGKSYWSTCALARQLGLSCRYPHKLWTDEENEKLLSMLSEYKYTYEDLSKEFGKSEAAISQHLRMIGTMMRPIPKEIVKKTD